ncbi:MAG: CARDB domain-containing protein [Candidatus Heimdallarchaeota archaeon]
MREKHKMKIVKSGLVLFLIIIVLGVQGLGIQRTIAEEATTAYTTESNSILWVTTSIDTAEWYTENTYTVGITVKAQQFGKDIDRFHEINIWAKLATAAYIDEQGPRGEYQLINEGDSKTVYFDFYIDPVRYNLEEPGYYYDDIEIEYSIEFTEGVVGGFDNHIYTDWDYALTVDIVSPYPPSLFASSRVTPSTVNEGESCTLHVTVENTGDLPAEGVTVQLSLPTGLSATSVSKNIGEVLGIEATSFTIYADEAGTYSIAIVVNAENADSTSTTQNVKVEKPETTLVVPEFGTAWLTILFAFLVAALILATITRNVVSTVMKSERKRSSK